MSRLWLGCLMVLFIATGVWSTHPGGEGVGIGYTDTLIAVYVLLTRRLRRLSHSFPIIIKDAIERSLN
jgi:hypothetical protein